MKEKLIFCLSLLALFVAFSASADAEEIHISAAASLTEATKEIIALYQQSHPEDKLLPNFASSGALAKQISAGAPADIYLSANPKWLDYLQQQQLIADASQRTLVQNKLVVVGLPNESIDSLQKLPKLSRVAICSPQTSPAGKYAEQALSTTGIYAQLLAERKLVLAKDVRQALMYADRAEVDAAIVYQTDARLAKNARPIFEVPQQLYPQIVYPAALTRTGFKQSAARRFYNYLFSAETQHILRKHGFLIP